MSETCPIDPQPLVFRLPRRARRCVCGASLTVHSGFLPLPQYDRFTLRVTSS